jgi:hypothetical protein
MSACRFVRFYRNICAIGLLFCYLTKVRGRDPSPHHPARHHYQAGRRVTAVEIPILAQGDSPNSNVNNQGDTVGTIFVTAGLPGVAGANTL